MKMFHFAFVPSTGLLGVYKFHMILRSGDDFLRRPILGAGL